MAAASLEALARPGGTARGEGWEEALEWMSRAAFEFYRESIADDPGVLDYFEEATPVLEFDLAKIGSRPARRSERRGLDDLRAIPWVFGWMQSRQLVPAWFGVGHAIEEFVKSNSDGLKQLQMMAKEFPLFVDIIRNVEMALAKSDFGIAKLYASLVEDEGLRERVYSRLKYEFDLTQKMLLAVTGQQRLLQTNTVLERSIRLRNPYVDPMSLIQVELIRRKRALVAKGEAASVELDRAISATINGISAGLRNTG
jgi:phosphoenolpyruvate carboxylase